MERSTPRFHFTISNIHLHNLDYKLHTSISSSTIQSVTFRKLENNTKLLAGGTSKEASVEIDVSINLLGDRHCATFLHLNVEC